MIYLFETEIPNYKSVFSGLLMIYGVGKSRSLLICKKTGICLNCKFADLPKKKLNKLAATIKSLKVELAADLKRTKKDFIAKLYYIKSYRGIRLVSGLPVRGQRTHTNARTSRVLKRLNQEVVKKSDKPVINDSKKKSRR